MEKNFSCSRDIQLVEFQLEIHTFSLLSLTKALFTLTNASEFRGIKIFRLKYVAIVANHSITRTELGFLAMTLIFSVIAVKIHSARNEV